MKLSTKQISREIDRRTIEEFGVPGVVLMENAGRAVASVILMEYPSARKIAVICGAGNNAGDGFVIARHLVSSGKEVSVHITEKKERYRGDAKTNLDSLLEIKADVRELDEKLPRIKDSEVIVDAVFGTGLTRKVEGFYDKLIKFINRQSSRRVSVDIPSGLDADTGQPLGTAVRADITVTFAPAKLGVCIHPGVDYSGKLFVADITIPKTLWDHLPFELLTFQKCRGLIKTRSADSHKGTYGHLLVLAGSPGKSGAAVLCAEAALRAGSGLVTLGVPKSIFPVVEEKTTEVMSLSLKDSKDGTLHPDALKEVLRELEGRKSALAVGPGISISKSTEEFVEKVITRCEVPVILDADALNIISKNPAILRKTKVPAIVTPHPGEMARLCGVSTKQVQEDRVGVAFRFSEKYGCYVVLKGARTVVSTPGGEVFINPTGNSAMATAGTGDVLTGIIGGLTAQGYDPLQSCMLGVFLHGQAADLLLKETGATGFTASEISRKIPASRNTVISSTEEKHFATVR
ncbi:MAG: NAD(P)H-hydrate dehydratase [Candidatus Dadabacteria bacterium]|nr:NAD(P)H-hydrate dehydratase [Candidatus Dadabacteria bacterium]